MSVAPNAGVVDLDTFLPPTGAADGVQGQVPKPLAGQAGYVLTGDGWASAGSVGLVGYQGTWNALTNTPTLTSSVGVQGYYYVVDVAGTTNLNGITDWQVGDWAIFNGSIWQKVDNTDSYDPANVAITGGTINNTVIGGTTPAAGTFTTLTAQNETLKGTGQNLLLQSQTFSNAIWSKQSSVTVTSNTTVAPDSTTTASTITADVDLGIYQSIASIIGLPYTQSVYVKAGTATAIMFRDDSGAGRHIVFNPSTGVITSTAGTLISSGSQSFGNGWYRYYFSYLADTTQVRGIVRPNSSGTAQTFFVWGAQTELASPAGTYIPTTTTAVYGTPTLSFSGVASIGLQSDGSLYHQPAGTGAVQAQATTSSATGGNARGANAVDWSTGRNAATQVASGLAATIGGGRNNTASGIGSVVAGGGTFAGGADPNIVSGAASVISGGAQNTNSGFLAVIAGGYNNTTSNSGTVVSGGWNNVATGQFSSTVGGYLNNASGIYNFIGGGYGNSGTALSIVTTQSATMNGTTAVTLSGSNASIKVGQYIAGTYISGDTYVAAVSGTSLTLSKVASGSGTATLAFYTPHGVVVGGGNNQATGSYSFIGGGGDAGTAANRNVASGDRSVVVGGVKNTASGEASFVGGGGSYAGGFVYANTASANASAIVGGIGNTASGLGAFVGAGFSNVANGTHSIIVGGVAGTTRSIVANHVFPACSNPVSGAFGASQTSLLVLGRETTNATPTVLTCDQSAASTINQVILPNNSAYYFKGSVIANVTGAANGASWSFEGAIMRGANAASTVLIGTVTLNRVAATAGASLWTVAITADTTNGGLAVTVTGLASTTIRWVAKLETTEVTF